MKNRTYTNRVLLTCAGSLLASLVYAEGEIAISNSPRTTITVDTSYIVETLKVDSDYPIATRPQFSFDCTQTNGWVIDAQNRVSKVTDLGGSTRYVTSVIDEINHSNYKVGTIDLWYNGWTKINAPTLMPADSMIKGPYLDFGCPGSHMLHKNRDKLELLASTLLEKESMDGRDIEELLGLEKEQ